MAAPTTGRLADLLEAESRGLLPPEIQADINEARRRGIIPSMEQGNRLKKSPLTTQDIEDLDRLVEGLDRPALRREKSGQLVFDPKRLPGELPVLGDPARAVVAGVRNLGGGVSTLPFDIAEAFGSETAGKIAQGIRRNVPEIRTGT